MSKRSQRNIIYRCPICLAREIDIVLHHTQDERYYCTKCSFTGTEADIRNHYEVLRQKFRLMQTRLTLEEIEGL